MPTNPSRGFFRSFRTLPMWAQLTPVAAMILAVMLLASLADNRALRAELTQHVSVLQAKPYAHGRISYEEARAFYGLLKHSAESGTMLHQKTYNERGTYSKAARELRDRVEPIFGAPSPCYSAAIMRAEYAQSMVAFANGQDMHRPPSWSDISTAMRSAYQYGENVAWCYHDIEALR